MKYPVYVTVATTILEEQNEWLTEQAIKRALPKSAILREAINLLMEKEKRRNPEKHHAKKQENESSQ